MVLIMDQETRKFIIHKEWTIEEALSAFEDLQKLEANAQWTPETPAWAIELAQALMTTPGSVISEGYRRISIALAKAWMVNYNKEDLEQVAQSAFCLEQVAQSAFCDAYTGKISWNEAAKRVILESMK
jgi:hypothetical protein